MVIDMKRLLILSRYLIHISVITSLVGAFAIVMNGAFTTINLISRTFLEMEFTVEASKEISIGFIEVIDSLFVGIVFYIFAIGLYHLFIENVPYLPRWLRFEEFEELKVILVSVVVVILAINFAGAVVKWDGRADIMQIGIAIALVITSISFLLYVRAFSKNSKNKDREG